MILAARPHLRLLPATWSRLQHTQLNREGLAEVVSTSFQADANETARRIAGSLTPAQRVVLVASLREYTKPEQLNVEAYVEELYASAVPPGGMITKGKFRDLMLGHVLLNDRSSSAAPSGRALRTIFLASAIPFLAFGFLDNFIMLTVGEEIDILFGARLGLSTLASAGLGNLVADVIGVSAAKVIEQGVKTLPFIKDQPKLSATQKRMPSVRMSTAMGSTIGVMIGCCLGLLPLFVSGTFWKH